MSSLLNRTVSVRTMLTAGIVGAVLMLGVNAIANQPHMESALGALKSARQELVQATANKGGHRANAIKLVDQAIGEVNEGIAAAK